MEGKVIKLCPECSEPIRGRSDKKFCCDLCRNCYNNKQNSTANKPVNAINIILRRNRQVLEKLKEQQVKKVSREHLLQRGFNFDYFTSIKYTKKGVCCYLCYEYGYHTLENNNYKLI
jgi:hypothetical protein